MKTDERDETALFSSSVFLQSSALFSLSRDVCVVCIFVRVEYILERNSRRTSNLRAHESKTEKHETAKNTSHSLFTQITCDFTKRNARLVLYFLLSRAREKTDRQTDRHTRARTHAVWSDYASAEETRGSERFVGYDRQQRRYLFRTHFTEVGTK